MKIVPVPVRSDNYAYLLVDDATRKAAAVDPYDVPKVKAAAEKEGVELIAVLTTHHHHDHAGGNAEFAKSYPGVPIYGGSDTVEAVTKIVKDKETFDIEGINVKCLATPCHTQDSICYHVTASGGAGAVFTGDTLFTGGCGRFFEGTGAEMHRALSYLGTLPDDTLVYNGHEYTRGDLAFNKSVDPEGAGTQRLQKLVDENEVTTGKSTIADVKEWNVFMRLGSEAVLKHTGLQSSAGESAIIDKLREQKNNFRG
jgi:hydroxyacylglutathione hydrolase